MGLGAAVRGRDGRGQRTVLERTVPAHFGVRRPWSVLEGIRNGLIARDRVVLELPPLVFAAAAHGDAVARSIVDALADEVVTMVVASLRRLRLLRTEVDVTLGGGVFRAEDPAFVTRIRAGVVRDGAERPRGRARRPARRRSGAARPRPRGSARRRGRAGARAVDRCEDATLSSGGAMARIVIEGVTKVFRGGVVAVNNVTIEVADGEFLVLVGPSGCGKTTLLRIVAGLEEVTDGEVAIGDTLVTDMPPRDRDVAMVFQNYALYPAHDGRREPVDRPAAAAPAQDRGAGPRRRGRPRPGARPAARAPPGRALGRPAPARRDGTGDGARAAGVPHGRAALEPRRQAARPDAGRARPDPRQGEDDDALRDPRPGRGDDARRSGGRHARRRRPAARHAAEPLPPPRQPVRGGVHRLAVDEPPRGPDRAGRRVLRRPSDRRSPAAPT